MYALTTSHYNGGLYAGGTFTTAGTPSANRLVRWAAPLPVTPINAAALPPEITIGESTTLSAAVPGSTIYWYADDCGGTQIGTGDSLVVAPTETTTYYARAFNGTCFSYACNAVTVTVQCAPPSPADAAAQPDVIIVGESATLTASAPGATIYWYTVGCATTLVGTGSPLVVTPAATTTYYARAYNGFCFSDACDAVTVTVNCAPPTITQQPVGGAICAGHSLQMCVTAQGAGTLHYQWRRNSLTLIGATAACYTATQVGAYTCVVTDDCAPRVSEMAEVRTANPQAGDFDGDNDTDLADFVHLATCVTGPDQGLAPGCECVDVMPDGQIDLADVAAFQTLYTN